MRGWERKNVNPIERGVSAALGALFVISALRRHGVVRKALALATGGALLARGIAGTCHSKVEWRQIEVSIDIRNEAAHNKVEFRGRTRDQIEKMIDEVRSVIVGYPA